MLFHALTLVLHAADPVAVAVTSERPGAAESSAQVALSVQQALKREGVAGVRAPEEAASAIAVTGFGDPKRCQGASPCLKQLAVLLGEHAVLVSVDVGRLESRLAVHLEAITPGGGPALAVADFDADAIKVESSLAVNVTLFARAVAKAVEARAAELKAAEVKPADAPTRAELTPPEKPEGPEVVAPAEKGSAVPAVVATGVTVAAAAVAIGCAIAAESVRGQYERSKVPAVDGTGTTLTDAELQALATRGNTLATASLVAALGAGATGTVAAVLWGIR
ncbi:MAG: hypothetical protein K1X89_03715 [Myxococcaceae bacterium]|nr:hypothetical protein [Myxococcaceae bacterium]